MGPTVTKPNAWTDSIGGTAFSDSWSATHVLTWYPRLGRVREWPVRLIQFGQGEHTRFFAQTIEDHQYQRRPAWCLDPVSREWLWLGARGYHGEPGVVTLEQVKRR